MPETPPRTAHGRESLWPYRVFRRSFVPIHWYDVDVSGFQSYVSSFASSTGLDIWVTEFACQNFNGGAQCSSDQTWALHQQMAAWFDEQPFVTRYAPFGMMENMQGVNQDNALMNPDGSITALGSWVSTCIEMIAG